MIKFEGVSKSKSLGAIGGNGIGVSVMVNAEVTSAEYVKDSDGKAKQSQKGNKQIKINLKVEEEITKKDGSNMKIPSFLNVTYYETDYSPKLKDITPKDKLKKFAQVKFNTGGLVPEGKDSIFGNFSVRNYIGNDGSPKNSVSIFGGNVSQPVKREGVYEINDYEGNKMVFTKDTNIKATIKGFIADITDTEKFIEDNYNAISKALKFDILYLENTGESKYDRTMPCVLENISEDRVMDFIKFVKSSTENVIGLKGKVKSTAIYGASEKESKSSFGDYSFGGKEVIGYEAGLVVDFDDNKGNWVIVKTKNVGKLVIGDESIAKVSNVIDEDVFPF